jgi:hypothetical protein
MDGTYSFQTSAEIVKEVCGEAAKDWRQLKNVALKDLRLFDVLKGSILRGTLIVPANAIVRSDIIDCIAALTRSRCTSII